MKLPSLFRPFLVLIALVSLTACSHNNKLLVTSNESNEIAYIIRPVVTGSSSELEIETQFHGSASGTTRLLLPSSWAGETKYYEGIKELRILTPDSKLSDTTAPDIKTVTHSPGALLRIRYRLQQDWNGDDIAAHRYRPILQSNYFHFFGYAAFVHPDFVFQKGTQIRLSWDLPKRWALANSFGVHEMTQTVHQEFKQLLHAVYVGGDFKISKFEVSGKPVYVANHGLWRFSDYELASTIEKIMTAERGFWNDYGFPFFLVTVLQTGPKCCDYGGTGLTQSFATFVALDDAIDLDLKNLLSHELFHTWNGRKIGRQQPEELVYWFSEGFTDYYMLLLNLRAGLITLPEYVDHYNRTLYRYYVSPVRNAKNERILKSFWNDRYTEKLAYQRGNILAHEWNRAIKLHSANKHSIDDFMHDLFTASTARGAVVSAETVGQLMRPYLKKGIKRDIAKYVDHGDTIIPSPGALGPCVGMTFIEDYPIDLGFDRAVLKSGAPLTGLNKTSNAYRAGLRNGMKLSGWNFNWYEPKRPARVKATTATGDQWFEYIPAGNKKLRIPQYKLDTEKFKSDPGSCLRWFGSSIESNDKKNAQK